MTFWTKLQHELLCFVCAEDEIFDSAGDHKKEHSRYRAVIYNTQLSNITPKFRACDVICESPIVINGRETFDNC